MSTNANQTTSDLPTCSICGKPEAGRRRPHTCDDCMSEYKKRWARENRKKNPDKWKRYAEKRKPYYRARRLKLRDQILAANRKRYRDNLVAMREKNRMISKEKVRMLKPCYIRQLITRDSNLTKSDITPELFEATKNLIILKRLLHENNEPNP